MQKLTRWGNSIGLRLGAQILAEAGLKTGDHVYVRLMDSGDIRVRPVKGRQQAESDTAGVAATTGPVKPDQW